MSDKSHDLLQDFILKADQCYDLIRRLDQEQKVKAIDKWNETSEKLQHVVNESFKENPKTNNLEDNQDQQLNNGVSIIPITSPISKSKVVHVLGKKPAYKPSLDNPQDQSVTITLENETVESEAIEDLEVVAFECKKCNKIFATKYRLSEHERDADCEKILTEDELKERDGQLEDTDQVTVVQDNEEAKGDDGDEAVYVNQHPKPVDESVRRIVRKGGDGLQEVAYQCEFCQKTYLSSHQLSAHRWFHTKPFTCHICRMRFPAKANLVVHIRSHTGEKPFSCSQCSGRFSTRGNLRRHERTHTGEKPWACNVCDSRFTEKKSLRIHLRKHTGERPYECQTCGKRFAQSGILSVHMAVHKEKGHKCSICNKSFRQKGQLQLHMQRHQGVRNYLCQICHQAKFATKEDLARHIRMHTGEKPYFCQVCEKRFSRQETLKDHVTKHAVPSYTCKECGKKFVHRSSCFRHCKTHDKIKAIVQKYQVERSKMEKSGATEQSLESLHSKYLEDVQKATADIVGFKRFSSTDEQTLSEDVQVEEGEGMTLIITDPEMKVGEREEYIIVEEYPAEGATGTSEMMALNPDKEDVVQFVTVEEDGTVKIVDVPPENVQ